MSHSPSLDVHGPECWRYAAVTMKNALAKMAWEGVVEKVPEGVRAAEEEFLALGLEATTRRVPKNPPASLSRLIIAREALARSLGREVSEKEGNTRLRVLHDFIERLPRMRRLSRRNLADLRACGQFFAGLEEMGAAVGQDACIVHR